MSAPGDGLAIQRLLKAGSVGGEIAADGKGDGQAGHVECAGWGGRVSGGG